MDRFDKLLSYLYPISLETTESEYNQFLEVVYRDGKYQLNSANANYSFGGLYDLFNLIFRQFTIDWENTKDILILGFGAGCTVPLIRQYNSTCKIVGVEIDGKVLELGRKYFGIDSYENTSIVCDSALNYVSGTGSKFDLAIIDVFIDLNVPSEIESKEFLFALKSILNPDGLVIFNKLIPTKSYKKQIPNLKNLYSEVFGNVKVLNIMKTGSIFFARRG